MRKRYLADAVQARRRKRGAIWWTREKCGLGNGRKLNGFWYILIFLFFHQLIVVATAVTTDVAAVELKLWLECIDLRIASWVCYTLLFNKNIYLCRFAAISFSRLGQVCDSLAASGLCIYYVFNAFAASKIKRNGENAVIAVYPMNLHRYLLEPSQSRHV